MERLCLAAPVGAEPAGGGGIQGIVANKQVPQAVKEALNAMQMAFADVLGTDGHRRLCRHEGVAYMTLLCVEVPGLGRVSNFSTRRTTRMALGGNVEEADDSATAALSLAWTSSTGSGTLNALSERARATAPSA